MLKRIVEISQARTYLSVRLGQLIIRHADQAGKPGIRGEQVSQIPCEDIGLLIVDHVGTTYTHSVLLALLEVGAAVILCGADHLPAGLFLPVAANSVQTARLKDQLSAKLPLKKKLWKQIIQAKIRHQAAVLGPESSAYNGLLAMARQVRSGDPENLEAQAAKKYWKCYMSGFDCTRRDPRAAGPPNNMLNYGYMVVRAAVARALAGAGLCVSAGIHHHNKYNAFCLADDLVEPFRGYVERNVREIWESPNGDEDFDDLNQPVKARLLEVLYEPVVIGGQQGPLQVQLHRAAASLVKCFASERDRLDLPKP